MVDRAPISTLHKKIINVCEQKSVSLRGLRGLKVRELRRINLIGQGL